MRDPSRIAAVSLVVVAIAGFAGTARAEIVVNGDATFRGRVLACFERFQGTGDGAADILNQLNQPAPKSHRHTISEETRPGVPNSESATDDDAAQMHGTQPGPGSDTNIQWNPSNRTDLQPGVPRDPCASLLHELKHAADDDKGMWNTGRHGTSDGIPETEVQACTEENKYRDKNPPLPQRTSYNVERPPGSGHWVAVPLPPQAMAPFH